jgi:hypothetical protein
MQSLGKLGPLLRGLGLIIAAIFPAAQFNAMLNVYSLIKMNLESKTVKKLALSHRLVMVAGHI